MIEFDWFEADEEADLSQAQHLFLAHLRERARGWPCRPEYTVLAEPQSECPHWRAVLDVSAELEKYILMTVGVCFDGASIWGGELHNQCYLPYSYERGRVDLVEATGSPEELAQIASDWFERILARPVERREWWDGDRILCEYVFSDTGTALSRSAVTNPRAFSRPPDRIIHARGTSGHAAG